MTFPATVRCPDWQLSVKRLGRPRYFPSLSL